MLIPTSTQSPDYFLSKAHNCCKGAEISVVRFRIRTPGVSFEVIWVEDDLCQGSRYLKIRAGAPLAVVVNSIMVGSKSTQEYKTLVYTTLTM